MSELDPFKALSQWPIIQAAAAMLVIFVGIWMVRQGEKDKKQQDQMPQWLWSGPFHDMMLSVHELTEETRRANDISKDIKSLTSDLLQETRNTRQTLELIRNESRMTR